MYKIHPIKKPQSRVCTYKDALEVYRPHTKYVRHFSQFAKGIYWYSLAQPINGSTGIYK